MSLEPGDDPEGLQYLWDVSSLPTEAFERMAENGYWSIPERLNPIFTGFMTREESRAAMNRTVRVADFRAERASAPLGSARWAVLGQWRGQKEWWHVGWITI